ncbi:MAG: hypothetical protein RR703_00205 [Bacilli bacterium]
MHKLVKIGLIILSIILFLYFVYLLIATWFVSEEIKKLSRESDEVALYSYINTVNLCLALKGKNVNDPIPVKIVDFSYCSAGAKIDRSKVQKVEFYINTNDSFFIKNGTIKYDNMTYIYGDNILKLCK